MKKCLVVAAGVLLSVYMFGCGKKEMAMEGSQESLPTEAINVVNTNSQVVPENKTVVSPETMQSPVDMPVSLEPLPPSGPYKPTNEEIQTALKNAGFYTAEVDGKIGPRTKKAIEEFQKTNNLQTDGKVGPKTWLALSRYLNPELPSPVSITSQGASVKNKR